MTQKEILKWYERKEIDFEQAMEALAGIGWCPNLLNDDAGRWAVACDGYQTVGSSKKAKAIETHFFVDKKQWKKSPREALLYALQDE